MTKTGRRAPSYGGVGPTLFTQLFLVCFFLTGIAGAGARAEDIIVINPKSSENDHRFDYSLVVLGEVFRRTEKAYGPYRLVPYPSLIPRKRALLELIKGDITVFAAPTQQEWEEQALPVRIPIRKGLLGYRLLLINKQDQPRFNQIRSVDGLKQLVGGGGEQWSATSALKRLGFSIESSSSYEALFTMLAHRRFDYFPRGVNEIFEEFDHRTTRYPSMHIEEHLAIYLPLPTYFFVTPQRPDLVQRIRDGLIQMVEDGSLDQLFGKFHGEALKRANLEGRKIFSLPNPNLTPQTPLNQPRFWYRPAEPKE